MTTLTTIPPQVSVRRPVPSLARFSRLRDAGFTVQQASALANAGYDIAEGVLFKPGGAR